MVKTLPAMMETWVQSMDWEGPLEEVMATHSSILPWRIPADRGAGRATVHGVAQTPIRLKRLRTHAYVKDRRIPEGSVQFSAQL